MLLLFCDAIWSKPQKAPFKNDSGRDGKKKQVRKRGRERMRQIWICVHVGVSAVPFLN